MKMKVCVCVYHFAIHEKLTQHWKLTILQFKKSKNQWKKKENVALEKQLFNRKKKYYITSVYM